MSAPAERVDVLRVMDDMASTIQLVSQQHKEWHARVIAARAAVAELIEVATTFERSIRSKYADDAATGHAALRAALARIGGAK